jgi:hypothetical protein
MTLYKAQPLIYLEDTQPDNGGCVIHRELWLQWQATITELMLVKITYGTNTYHLHVESFHTNEPNTVFIPQGCFIAESNIEVSMELVHEMPPLATKITLQPLDSEIYHCDIVVAVSEHLSKWQVLSVGTTLSVPCPELGGFLVDVFVKNIEPASTVLLRGEVNLELDEPIETVAEWIKKTSPRPPSPHPHTISSLQGFFPEETVKAGFVPFSGKGYSLR